MSSSTSAGGFLDYVSFNGWDYLRQPPTAIKDSCYLQHGDHWLRFCCVLERAKVGDFEHRKQLPELWNCDDTDLRFAAQYLFACIGRRQELLAFDADIVADNAPWRMEAADHAAMSGSLSLVDTFIHGYRVGFGETTRAAMEDGLSNLLSPDPESRLVVDCLLSSDRAAGEERLRDLARKQEGAHGADTSLRNAVPLTATSIIDEIESTIVADDACESFEHLQGLVTRLQTMVGFSQVSMFNEDERAWNEAAIRHQLDECRYLEYAAGTRYFFGHPAPL